MAPMASDFESISMLLPFQTPNGHGGRNAAIYNSGPTIGANIGRPPRARKKRALQSGIPANRRLARDRIDESFISSEGGQEV